jgi:hypothetical protein
MSFSPMFRLLVKDLKASLAQPSDEVDWYYTLFGARIYKAGLKAGRLEAMSAQNGGAR